MGARERVKAIGRRRGVRAALVVVACLLAGSLAFGAGFHLACRGETEPDAPYAPPAVQALAAEFPEYKRPEESTYLTLLEWYQVFSYQEYAGFIAEERPSAYPYFTAIAQSWTMYCRAYGLTEDAYPFNVGNHVMLFVIGTSFAAEYALKGVYENTVGRLMELDGHDTDEDRYAAFVAEDYGRFIERDPWYAYPFAKRTLGIWTENDYFEGDFLRKMERRTFLTLEYGSKAVYAAVIHVATRATYGAPPAVDYLWVANASEASLAVEGVETVRASGDGEWIITLPHYQGFTDAVPQLARNGVRFVDISGNDEIVLTVLAPADWAATPPAAEELFRLPVPTDAQTHRVVVRSPVPQLHEVLLRLEESGARIEHLFDY